MYSQPIFLQFVVLLLIHVTWNIVNSGGGGGGGNGSLEELENNDLSKKQKIVEDITSRTSMVYGFTFRRALLNFDQTKLGCLLCFHSYSVVQWFKS